MTACIFPMITSDSHGQVDPTDSLRSVDFLDYYNQPAPEDVEESPSDVGITVQKGSNQKGAKGGKGCGCRNRIFGILPCRNCGDEPRTLFHHNNCRGIEVGGWTQFGYHGRGVNVGNQVGTGLGMFNNRPNQFQLQQMWAYVEKAVDTSSDTWDMGFRVDYVYGTDAQNTQAFGNKFVGAARKWDNPWDNGSLF
ncbi:MAG: outer membrane beta-barrel protein, partial [Planctomycetes bacterium]|nr:outer membrane beta-barrel protein [Planctomycetota bacterium]